MRTMAASSGHCSLRSGKGCWPPDEAVSSTIKGRRTAVMGGSVEGGSSGATFSRKR